MTDILERAGNALLWASPAVVPILRELVAELEAARAENDRLLGENERLRCMWSGSKTKDRSAPQFPGTGLGPQG